MSAITTAVAVMPRLLPWWTVSGVPACIRAHNYVEPLGEAWRS